MILIIDNYDSFTYNLYQAVAQFDTDVKVVRNDKISIEQIAELNPDGIIISPGPSRPENAGISIACVKQFSGKIPILGVCLGHQAIVQAFGGRVDLADKPVHGKPVHIFHQRQGLYQDMSLPFLAGRYHSLVALQQDLPNELRVDADSGDGMIMGVRHTTDQTFGVQFHPESILTLEGTTLLKNFVAICHSQHHREDHANTLSKPTAAS